MNKRILLAWELGRGRGHAFIAGWIARALKQRGYEPTVALKQLDCVELISTLAPGTPCIQAPIWPTILTGAPIPAIDPPVTMGDTMGQVGLRSTSVVRQVIHAWDQLFALIEPAAVVADFSPGVLLAARGRMPAVAVGDSTTLPPSTMKTFPLLSKRIGHSKFDEAESLDAVNTALKATSRKTLDHLPQVFSAERSCTAAFSELDPYREFRVQPNAAPWAPAWDRTVAREGDEVFGYFSAHTRFQTVIIRALQEVVRSGIPVRVHMPLLDPEAIALLEEIGILVERTPLPFEEIQRRSRLVVSISSLGFVSCALAAAIPQILLPPGIFDHMGPAIEHLGVGRSIELDAQSPIEPALLAQAIIEAYRDDKLAARAKEVAPDFARRLEPRPEEVVARYVEELIGPA
jgi:rhamnosyltransferase subunit B